MARREGRVSEVLREGKRKVSSRLRKALKQGRLARELKAIEREGEHWYRNGQQTNGTGGKR